MTVVSTILVSVNSWAHTACAARASAPLRLPTAKRIVGEGWVSGCSDRKESGRGRECLQRVATIINDLLGHRTRATRQLIR